MRNEISSQPNFDQTLLNLFEALNDRPIVYHGVYSQIMGTTSAGLVTSQLIYWSKVMGHKQFYKTDAEIFNELKMGSKELRNAKKRIIESGVFELTVKGVPPKTYYQINLKKLIGLINEIQTKYKQTEQINLAQRDKLESPEGANQFSPKGQIITEKTHRRSTDENKNNKPKAIGCAVATAKKLSSVEQKPVTKPKPQPDPKVKLTQQPQLEPDGSVVVGLMNVVKGWAVSRVLMESWLKKHGLEYLQQKIELTKSANAKNPGAYLNKAVSLDWMPPAPKEDEEASNKPVEPTFPVHEENVAWYDKLAESEKLELLSEAVRKNPYLEEHLKNANISVLDTGFSNSTWFKMMMSNVGRAI